MISRFIKETCKKILTNDFFFNKFVEINKEKIKGLIDQYPNIINNGYRHIDKSIEYVKLFNLNQDNIIIDIGAADGTVSLKYNKAFPLSTIYSFEPIAKAYNKLFQNTKSNNKIIAINKALGDEHSEKEIHISSRITSSSILDINPKITNDYFAEQLLHCNNEKITISKLDDEIPNNLNISIIKIDVQGFELKVLQGAEETLKRTFLVLLEMQNHDFYKDAPSPFILDKFLKGKGFELYDIIPSIKKNYKLYEWDGIYLNKSFLRSYK